MQSPSDLCTSYGKNRKKSIRKNIKQTELNLFAIKSNLDQNILPFSLKRRMQSQFAQNFEEQKQGVHNYLSNDSSKFSKFQSRNINSLAQEQNSQCYQSIKPSKINENSSKFTINLPGNSYTHYNIFGNQQNMQDVSNNLQSQDSSTNIIQLQIHLTIAKKKYTLKISNHHENNDLSQIVQMFLVQNQISNPSRKSHNKTKNSIIEMVEKKLLQRSKQTFQQIKRLSRQKKINDQVLRQSQKKKQTNTLQNRSPSPKKLEQQNKQHFQGLKQAIDQKKKPIHKVKYQKPAIKQKSKVDHHESYDEQNQQACSPSFKSAQCVNKSPIIAPSRFSPEPKHKENRYQKLVANYYNDKVVQNQNKPIPHHKQIDLIPRHKLNHTQKQQKHAYDQPNHTHKQTDYGYKQPNHAYKQLNYTHKQPIFDTSYSKQDNFNENQNQNRSQYSHNNQQTQQPNAKSVYEKWKQRQKQKQTNKNINRTFDNALKEKKLLTNFDSKKNHGNQYKQKQRQASWNNKITKNNFDRSMREQRPHKKTIHLNEHNDKSQKNQKQNLDQRSTSNIKSQSNSVYARKNDRSTYETKSPNKTMNRTQVFNSTSFESNHSPYHQSKRNKQIQTCKSPINHMRSRSNINIDQFKKNQKLSDQDLPEQQSVIHEISPDHFYKKGLLFEAKRNQQIEQKFKQIYPFTTRGINQQQSRQKSAKSNRNSNMKSRQKYFSSKLSNNRSSSKVTLQQKQRSTLHQRLFKEDKSKKTKRMQVQTSKKIYVIAKNPRSQSQINLMQENLKQIKGLSRQRKTRLIQKNVEIKQKIRQKDRIIDQELQIMIKEGKVKQNCHFLKVPKSPFRKTKIF